jgi:hypothetical protein
MDDIAIDDEDDLPADPAWWEDWYAEAIAAGVPEDVASAGRTLMRVALEEEGPGDRWDDDISDMAGIEDDGLAMIEFGVRRPGTALRVWRRIAATSGLRGERTDGKFVRWDRARIEREKHALYAEFERPEQLD